MIISQLRTDFGVQSEITVFEEIYFLQNTSVKSIERTQLARK